ncbi:hypothetical protein B566_EDAN004745 [Ephemera danica]|nr:hypothetical protein B566_EDAN004745 [Ephemera danica]
MVGQHIPLIPMKHAYVVTEEVPGGVRTLPNVRDHDSSVYFRVQGDALCVGGYEPNPIILDSVDKELVFGLYELDWDVFSVHVRGAVQLAPLLETTGIKSTVCGPESFTPDHKPLLGEDPSIRGFFYGCGFNSSGMMLGGGCGEQLAQWIIHGRPELHMYAYDIRRYTLEQRRNVEWARERSHEAYAKNYSIVFPHDEPLAGRNLKQDPFHKALLDEGCVFQERLGWERPGWFTLRGPAPVPEYDWYGAYGTPRNPASLYKELLKGDYSFGHPEHHHVIGQECHACRNQAALFDMSYFGKLYLSGPEAQLAADWLFTADTRRALGRTVYTCALNRRGGVEGDLTVSAIETGYGGPVDPIFKGRGFYLAVGGASAYHSRSHINWVLQERGFKAQISDLSEQMGLLSIQGPNSRRILQNLVDTDLNNDSFPFSTTKLVKIAGHLCRAIRLSFVGELGWELHIPRDSCMPIYKAVIHEGKKHGGGSAGCNTLYQLARRGVRAVLLERAKLTAGTTWHTAGLIWRLRPNDVEIQLLGATRDLLMRLEAETGERLDEYSRLATAGRSFGIESRLVSPAEARSLFPLIDEKALYGALYCPGDGTVDPTGLCTALTRAATRAGASVIENCPITGIKVERNAFGTRQVEAVKTPFVPI